MSVTAFFSPPVSENPFGPKLVLPNRISLFEIGKIGIGFGAAQIVKKNAQWSEYRLLIPYLSMDLNQFLLTVQIWGLRRGL